jgi:hypothetical protein
MTLVAAGYTPPPPGRDSWYLTLHTRAFVDTLWQNTIIGRLDGAMSRKLVQAWDQPATLSWVMDGHDPQCAVISELAHDVVAWRWDEVNAADVPVFRGIIDQSEDQLDEDSHLVTFSAQDYVSVLARRTVNFANQQSYAGQEQDNCVVDLIAWANQWVAQNSAGTHFGAGAYMPLVPASVNPDGSGRTAFSTGITRTLAVQGGTIIGTQLDNYAKLSNGFDYDVLPLCTSMPAAPGMQQSLGAAGSGPADALRIFFPSQGVNGTFALTYGSTLSRVQRQLTSADYANYWRTVGNNQNSAQSTTQVYAEAQTAAASATTYGTFMSSDTATAADQTSTTYLAHAASGQLNLHSVWMPTYTLTLAPGAYHWGALHMGDTVPLVVRSGRLNVNTTVRVLGVTYDIGDDGQEDVELVVGRPLTTLFDTMGTTRAGLRAVSRR